MVQMPVFHHTGALGDFLLSLPFLRALRLRFPEAAWTLAVPEEHARLVARIFPCSARIAPGSVELAALTSRPPSSERLAALLDRHGGLFGFVPRANELTALAREVRPEVDTLLLEPFSLTLEAGETVESVLEPATGCVSGADFAIAPHELPPLADPGELAGLPEDRAFAIVHIGASDPAKRPPPAAVEREAALCAARGLAVVWARGPVEREREIRLPEGPALDAPSLVGLAHAIARASQYVGGDTGPTHLAAALGTPVVALQRAPNPLWRPRGANVRIVLTG